MDLSPKERDRLLQRTARFVALCGSLTALGCLLVPGLLEPRGLAAALGLLFVLTIAQWRLVGSASEAWSALAIAAGVCLLALPALPLDIEPSLTLATALAPVGGAALAAVAIPLKPTPARIVLLVIVAASSTILVHLASGEASFVSVPAFSTAVGWLLSSLLGFWLRASMPRARRRVQSIGNAHRAERLASETEAQRRQSARLLHDTVLATLTLLAHSGVGVSEAAMRQQAADDARLLRQLRLGATPTPQSSGQYTLEPVAETVLGTTLESVKHRFGRMGLEVSWHGTGQVLLPSDVLDAFLLALAECLENVRRHSGVTQAHVTITDDETTVRAMVSDSGSGFDLDGIDEHKLGFKESVVGRLREVGGNARLFTAPGQGTTVVLEVPR